jgi:hypothetical protein
MPKRRSPSKIHDARDVLIPDAWHLYSAMLAQGPAYRPRPGDAELLLKTWHLCHDLLAALKESRGLDPSYSSVAVEKRLRSKKGEGK